MPYRLNLTHWTLPSGPHNAISDVDGVMVGHSTLIGGDGALRPGQGPVRTGVTVVLPHGGNLFQDKVVAAVHTINGFGKACGFEQVRELGVLETPIALTNTLSVWQVADALAQHAVAVNPAIGITTSTVNPVVGECNDGYLNDIQGRHVQAQDVWAAIAGASGGTVAAGCVGAGAGVSCYGWKGGIGTSSRRTAVHQGGFTVGALVQSNFGRAAELVIGGVAVGRFLRPPDNQPMAETPGSVMIVLATDAPLCARQLGRLCRRAALGLARTGSTVGHGSGDFVIAFSVNQRIAHTPAALTAQVTQVVDEERVMDGLLPAVVESVEEAVINSLCAAHTTRGRDGHIRYTLPLPEVAALVRQRQE